MQVVWKLCLAHIRHNKIKNLLVALLILLAALLLGAASVVLANSGNVFGKMHEQTNGSHQLLTLDQHIHDPQRVHAWWAAQSGVQVSKLERFRALSGLAYKGADIPNQYLMLMEKTQAPAGVDELIFAQGEQQAEPANGTVWIPTSLAYTQGIAAGDSISIKAGAEQLELQVAAIVIDVPYGAPFSNTARIWINAQDYAAHISTLAGEDAYVMGLRFDDYSQMPSYWQRFEQEWGTPYLESRTEFSEISSFYLIINQIVGFVLIFLGSIMMLIALLTVGFAISDAISANYRTIGILKASGMTSGRITEVYTLQYAGLSLAAIIPGTAISWYISGFFIDLSMSTLKPEGGTLPVQGLSFAALVGLLLWLLITLFAMFYAGQTRSIQPVQAIRYGMSEQASSRSASRMRGSLVNRLGFGRLPLAAVIGLRSAASNRKGSILTLILSTLAASVLVLGVVMLSSIGGIRHTAPQWGYDNSHIAAIVVNPATFSHAAFAQALGDDPRIINFGWQGNISGIIPSRSASAAQPDGSTTLSIYISVLDGSYEELGFKTLTGVDPVQRNEISIGVNIARELGKRIGDTIDVYIDGEKQTFLITGIYQAIANTRHSRITMQHSLTCKSLPRKRKRWPLPCRSNSSNRPAS
jgi:putative ABC transport system permease protein